jgi:DNA-binding NarL/FixJ family response regulator
VRVVAPRGHSGSAAESAAALAVAPVSPSPKDGTERAAPDALKILIVDDHAAVRGAIRDLLNERPQFVVVGDAANGIEAIAQAHRLRPDVVLMDIAMPQMDGVEATARLRAELPDIRIFGLSMQPRIVAAHAMEQAGAEDYFVKGIETRRLIEHLLVVHASRAANLTEL